MSDIPSIDPESMAELLKISWLLCLKPHKAFRMSVVYLRKIVVCETDTPVRAWLPAPECTLNGHCNECNESWRDWVEWCSIVTNALGRFLARIEPLLSKKKCKYLIHENTDTLSEDIISRNKCGIHETYLFRNTEGKSHLAQKHFYKCLLLSCDEIP
jgi:hypothetical protein